MIKYEWKNKLNDYFETLQGQTWKSMMKDKIKGKKIVGAKP
jgi:hypothetical protein